MEDFRPSTQLDPSDQQQMYASAVFGLTSIAIRDPGGPILPALCGKLHVMPGVANTVSFADSVRGLIQHIKTDVLQTRYRGPEGVELTFRTRDDRSSTMVMLTSEFTRVGGPGTEHPADSPTKPTAQRKPLLFELELLGVSPGVVHTVAAADYVEAVYRHMTGEWGSKNMKAINDAALAKHRPLVSTYQAGGRSTVVVWTSSDRSQTNVLLLQELTKDQQSRLTRQSAPVVEKGLNVAQRLWQSARTFANGPDRSAEPRKTPTLGNDGR